MIIEVNRKKDVKIIQVFGKVGFENSVEFKNTLIENISECDKIVLDFTNLTYLNSMGLGIIVKAYTKASEEDRKLWVCGLSENIKKLFSITKLDNIITIKEDLEDALISFDEE
ncbi:MAG: STAS domain-containing protein [Peptostreptococcaceae bacterium]|jgi:anti-anti-sigma factor|nr:STAS domain-containing protein [Peptostreptococcaceae bacterium]